MITKDFTVFHFSQSEKMQTYALPSQSFSIFLLRSFCHYLFRSSVFCSKWPRMRDELPWGGKWHRTIYVRINSKQWKYCGFTSRENNRDDSDTVVVSLKKEPHYNYWTNTPLLVNGELIPTPNTHTFTYGHIFSHLLKVWKNECLLNICIVCCTPELTFINQNNHLHFGFCTVCAPFLRLCVLCAKQQNCFVWMHTIFRKRQNASNFGKM